jgi:hypothetical protein
MNISIRRTIIGATADKTGDFILSGGLSFDTAFFNTAFSKRGFSPDYASLLFYKNNSGYVLAHIQGEHSKASGIYNSRLIYEFAEDDFKNCGYDILSLLEALPKMELYKSKEDIKPFESSFTFNKKRPQSTTLSKQLCNIMRSALLENKKVYIKLQDNEETCYENEIFTQIFTKALLNAIMSLDETEQAKVSFALSVDKNYENYINHENYINELLVVAYRGDINLPQNVLSGTWDGYKISGIDVNETTIREVITNKMQTEFNAELQSSEKYQPLIEPVVADKIKSKIFEADTYENLFAILEKIKAEKNIEFLNVIEKLDFNESLKNTGTKKDYKKILKYAQKYSVLLSAVPEKYKPVSFGQKVKNTLNEMKRTKQNFILIFILFVLLIGLALGYVIGWKFPIKLEKQQEIPVDEQIPTEQKAEFKTPEIKTNSLVFYGKINNKTSIELNMLYTDKGLILKPLIDTIKSNSITIDSIKIKDDKLIVPPLQIQNNDSRKLYYVLDTLHRVFQPDMKRTTDSLTLYSKGKPYKCFIDTTLKRVPDILAKIPSNNIVDSVFVNETVIKIDNELFKEFNDGHARTLSNFTYCLWLLNEIQQTDTTKTIKY